MPEIFTGNSRHYTAFLNIFGSRSRFSSFLYLPGHFNEQCDCVRYGIKELSPGGQNGLPGG